MWQNSKKSPPGVIGGGGGGLGIVVEIPTRFPNGNEIIIPISFRVGKPNEKKIKYTLFYLTSMG